MKVQASDLSALWIIESELAGAPGIVGVVIKIQVQQVNPMIRRLVAAPAAGGVNDERYAGVFSKIKPSVSSVEGDLLLCSLGIVARRKK